MRRGRLRLGLLVDAELRSAAVGCQFFRRARSRRRENYGWVSRWVLAHRAA
jgi:hypothetical protein